MIIIDTFFKHYRLGSPTNIIWIDHGHQFVHRDEHIIAIAITPQEDCGGLRDGSIPIGLLHASPGPPLQLTAISLNGRCQRGAVVSAPADEHEAQLGHLAFGADLEGQNFRLDLQDIIFRYS